MFSATIEWSAKRLETGTSEHIEKAAHSLPSDEVLAITYDEVIQRHLENICDNLSNIP